MDRYTIFFVALIVIAIAARLIRRWFLNWFDTKTTLNTIERHKAKKANVITFKTTPEIKTKLEQAAKANNCSTDEIINELLNKYIVVLQ